MREKKKASEGQTIFESWELILFYNLRDNGKIEKKQFNAAVKDLCTAMTKAEATVFLQGHIDDMVEQLAEQRMKSA
ncbi:hypothetical protein PAECIP111893_02403 [Paenibacillus plantiphilus]|uniref:EF-hand domain-containing protein n=1 Tax=Paenibacillus plantiphilus TaxID=2905650 RepID=A0ABM9C9V6_9BACL|nr:hypothetical protein [Paenibacillus plantiphilus]CAH1205727.1 hypothetical protein PAECIP111893_02403 [Paenibacillus plantiphilus]